VELGLEWASLDRLFGVDIEIGKGFDVVVCIF
jgi:hypothetical protein